MIRITPVLSLTLLFAVSTPVSGSEQAAKPGVRRPNIVLIMTDDQGWGDLGFHGNNRIKTPQLDSLARQSVVLRNFYVSPVCTPTRASLMTGRYNYRTGAIDTFRGRAMMHAEEVTLAEMLAAAGYRTGIFGKWHLGDNYPLRARDQGFQESLTLAGGGLVQWADPPQANGNSYFNPWLSHNGADKQFDGYCSDVYTDAAIEYIATHRDDPFLVYLAYNCPHTPLQVRDEDYVLYTTAGLSDTDARIYGMVTNIDNNVGRLLKKLDELSLADDTIVIFMTDNGPQQPRINGKWRGLKGSVYEGGIHVPFFIRWPRRLKAGHTVEQPAAHIDVVPTLLAACEVQTPEGVKLDGVNLLSLLEGKPGRWPDRNLFFQWHRGDEPQIYRAFAVRGPRYKLVQAAGVAEQAKPQFRFELFDLTTDPGEQHDLAADKPDVVAKLKEAYERWFRDVSATRGYAPPLIHVGNKRADPVRLSRQDLRGFSPSEPGHWAVHVEPGNYNVRLLFAKRDQAGRVLFAHGKQTHAAEIMPGQTEAVFEALQFSQDDHQVRAWIEQEGSLHEVRYVELHRK